MPESATAVLVREPTDTEQELTSVEKSIALASIRIIQQELLDQKPGVNTLYNRSDAEHAILRIGRKVLPLVREQLVKHGNSMIEIYEFSSFLNNLHSNENLGFILETFNMPEIKYNQNSAYFALNLVNPLIDIISKSGWDGNRDELEDLALKLKEILKDPNLNFFIKQQLLVALALTGTKTATDSLLGEDIPQFTKTYLLDLVDLQQRQSDTYYLLTKFWNGREKIYKMHYLDSQAEDRSTKLVNKYLQNFGTAALGCTAALTMHFYNFLTANPQASDEVIEKELLKFKSLIETEIKCSHNPKLPSVGVEVETSNDTFFIDKEDNGWWLEFLRGLGVDVSTGGAFSSEFKTPPSACATVQNRLISELMQAGLIPTDKAIFASMHINIGIPIKKEVESNYYDFNYTEDQFADKQLVLLISDLLTYAFIPSWRVKNRDFSDTAFYIGKSIEVNIKEAKEEDENSIARMEFRTPRVIGAKTYRLIAEVQRLGTLLVSSDPEIISLKEQFIEDVSRLLKKYGLTPNMPAEYQDEAAKAIQKAWNTKIYSRKNGHPTPINLVDEARSLMTDYSLKIHQLLTKKASIS